MSGHRSADSNVVWQRDDQPLSELMVSASRSAEAIHLRHAVNLYRSTKSLMLDAVQSATVNSMRRARTFAAAEAGRVEVSFVAVHTSEDGPARPADFIASPPLLRTIRDFPGFRDGRPFPLLFDVLNSAGTVATDGYLIFTNADICLQPHFYLFVHSAIAAGYDSLVVNRRTIPNSAIELPPAVGAAEVGTDHPGLDCFVFPAAFIERFAANDACLGAGFAMRGLLHNLVAVANRLLVITRGHLTYHFGDDRIWMDPESQGHMAHNRIQDRVAYDRLCPSPRARHRLEMFHAAHPKYAPPPPAS